MSCGCGWRFALVVELGGGLEYYLCSTCGHRGFVVLGTPISRRFAYPMLRGLFALGDRRRSLSRAA